MCQASQVRQVELSGGALSTGDGLSFLQFGMQQDGAGIIMDNGVCVPTVGV
jgi:hypothetical protein